ncbi:DUF4145 domain-containing protein [Vibrio parahaemolyticus]|uniref:DUF4145 domain-containing protein n=1 Tax=Vibrio parahaemolyticus TaxID=670 RepID=UPI00221EB141|nr:DUF4145 domain-containing protein [Vibrio parahaemolyticus]EJB1797745.1 DUF4145 domain-containing protein [Vibrio parahaemolyticus]
MNAFDIYREATEVFTNQEESEVIVAIKLRNLVEEVSKQFAESLRVDIASKSLGERIEALNQTGALPHEVYRAMQYIRIESNKSIHSANEIVNAEQLLRKAYIVALCYSRFVEEKSLESCKDLDLSISSALDSDEWMSLLKVTVKLNSEYVAGFEEWANLRRINDLISIGVVNDEIIDTYLSLRDILDEILLDFNQKFRVSLNEARSGSIEIDAIIHIYNSNKDIIDLLTLVKDWGGWLVSLSLLIKMQVSKKLNNSNLSNVSVAIDEESLEKIKEIVQHRID